VGLEKQNGEEGHGQVGRRLFRYELYDYIGLQRAWLCVATSKAVIVY
jgi:hypothetical protein